MPKKPTQCAQRQLMIDKLGHDPARVQVTRSHKDLFRHYCHYTEGDPMRLVDLDSLPVVLLPEKARRKRVI